MNDIELFNLSVEAAIWMPYIYFRKMTLAHYEFIEDLLNVV